jgi:cytochrome c-type biogenesis protein CcmH
MKLKKISKIIIFILSFLTYQNQLFSFSPEQKLADEEQEKRARKFFLEVRCLVCQGQVIESSDAEFAFEMRKLIRSKIAANKSDKKIRFELEEEFGKNIFIQSNLTRKNFLIWLIPMLVFIFSLIFFIINHKK